ncbi:DUF6311 domain-containing protein [Elstera cyanobacteriorum]|nr:DUF6311 domain-containing protein [Elstera cyanobacteriorum]
MKIENSSLFKSEYIFLFLIGISAFYIITGGSILLFDNTSWLFVWDSSQHYAGWAFFRNAPWSFPIGLNTGWGLELRSSIIFTDSLPIFALFFKIFSQWLPETFQYFGLWILICFMLQTFFSWKILRYFVEDRWVCVLATGFFVTAPPMLWRLHGHTSLFSHFVILAALYLYISGRTARRPGYWLLLLGVTALVHPYLLAITGGLWVASLGDGVIVYRLGWKRTVTEAVAGLALIMSVAWQAGYFSGGSGVMAGGFGFYRMNLLSLIDANGWSRVLPDIAGADGDYEGFSYLGLGGLALAVLAIPRGARALRGLPAVIAAHPAMTLMVFALVLFALSNKIGIGTVTYTIPLADVLKRIANFFQSSGRFFWPVYYAIFLTLIIFVAQRWRGWGGRGIIALALILQIWDITPGWTFRSGHLDRTPSAAWNLPLTSGFWAEAAKRYHKLRVIMPENHPQIRRGAPENGMGDWVIGAGYALRSRMETDIVYFARLDQKKLEAARDRASEALATGRYDPDTLYLLDEASLSAALATIRSETDLLARIDGFVVLAPGWRACATCTPIEPLKPETLFLPAPLHQDIRLGDPASAPFLAMGWYTPEPWGVWSRGKRAVLVFRDLLPGRVRLRLTAHAFGPNKEQEFQLQFGDRTYPFRLSDATTDVTLEMESATPSQVLTIVVPTPTSPAQLGHGPDPRTLGIGLVGLNIEPLSP